MHTILNSWGAFVFNSPDILNVNIGNLAEDCLETVIKKYAGNTFILLEGGSDINPRLYNEENIASYFNNYRDHHERLVYEIAMRLGVPILGICRGHQLLNVLQGGTLYQDLKLQYKGAHSAFHPIILEKNQKFIELMHTNPMESYVNSMHHQGLKDVAIANNAKILATSEDGLVEAVDWGFGLSVQWHPEFLHHIEFVDYMFEHYVYA